MKQERNYTWICLGVWARIEQGYWKDNYYHFCVKCEKSSCSSRQAIDWQLQPDMADCTLQQAMSFILSILVSYTNHIMELEEYKGEEGQWCSKDKNRHLLINKIIKFQLFQRFFLSYGLHLYWHSLFAFCITKLPNYQVTQGSGWSAHRANITSC